MIKSQMSITKKLITTFLLSIILPMGTIGIISYLSAKKSLLEGTNKQIQNSVQNYVRILELGYNEASKGQSVNAEYANTLIHNIQVDSGQNISTKAINQITGESTTLSIEKLIINGEEGFGNQKLIDHIAEKTKSTVTLFQRIPQGFLRIATNIKKQDGTLATGTYIANDSPVAQSLIKGESYFGKAFVVDQWYLTGYMPLLTKDNRVVGAIYTGASVKNIIETFSNDKVLENGYVFIVNKENGKLVKHATQQNEDLKKIDPPFGEQILKEISQKTEGEIQISDSDSKLFSGVILHYSYFKPLDWYIVTAVYEKDILASVTSLRTMIIIFSIVFISIAGAYSFYFGNTLSLPIIEISKKLLENTNNINQIVTSLNEASTKLSEAATQQASSVEETSASLEEISGMATRNQELNHENDELASNVLNYSQETTKDMSALEKSMIEIQKSNDQILTLVDVINQIGQKTQIMDEIVFQTKLLSFNASVEAERAGEHGRGFMVVAQEVGNLASLTGKSANEISTIVKESIVKAKIVTSEASSKVQEGSKHLKTSHEAIKVISTLSSKVKDSSLNIVNSFEQQQRGISQITQAMSDIDQKTQSNAELASKTEEISQELAREANEIKESASSLFAHVLGQADNATLK